MRQAVSGNTFSKVVFGLTAVLLVFVPPTARAAGAAEAIPDFRFCEGYFARCAASTCTRTGKQIAVNTITGRTRNFPEADCTCPVILGTSIANLSGGNMKGSCDPPGAGTLVDLSAQTGHSAGAYRLGPTPAGGRSTTAGLSGEPQTSVCAMLQLQLRYRALH